MKKIIWLIALLSASSIAAAAATITEDDYRRLVALESPAISPDGKDAAVVVTRILWDADKRGSDLVLVDLATLAQRTLIANREGLSSPAFSPDGTRVAFLADEGTGKDAHAQIFVMPLDGGAPRAVTHDKADVDQFAWRPDGGAFAYAASDPDPQRIGADRFHDSFIFTTEPIVAREFPQPAHIFTVSLDDGTTTQLTVGAQSIATGEAQSTLSWSADAKTIAFTLVPNAILNDQSYSRVALLDVATKTVHPLTGRTAWEGDPLFSPDGAHIAYSCAKGDSQVNLVQLCVTTPAGGIGTRVSAAVDRPVSDAAWSHDSQSLLFTAPDRATIALYRATLDGPPVQLDLGGINVASSLRGAIAGNGTVVFVGSATKQPPELFARTPDGTTTKLTDFNAAIAALDLSSAQRITFPTSTGTRADGVLYIPPGFERGKKCPLVVFIHGGPTSSSALTFSLWAQVMAARGWLVLQPNYRGSDDLGLAYQRAVLYDPEDGPGKDIMAAVRA
ncbi:MAG: S9 family peptidase, partial [Candidatus Eremiobacteraeota bacterium]|nr:S9 family peptidase [Candidatus Eremiobacteraeota bacterium]